MQEQLSLIFGVGAIAAKSGPACYVSEKHEKEGAIFFWQGTVMLDLPQRSRK